MSGRLVVVGTPLGNLGDLAPRAIDALRDADAIACEDTRRTGRLLAAADVGRRELVVVNDHTEADAIPGLIDRIRLGEVVALVSDAGMPVVSDPGGALIAAVAEAGLEVGVVPGATAATTALALAGLPAGRWVFEGFLPRKGSGRAERLADLATEQRTVVLYEAPHRVARTLADLVEGCGSRRPVVLARELTKLHEEIWRGTLAEAVDHVAEHEPRGEFVLVLGGAEPPAEATDDELRVALDAARAAGDSTRDAVAAVAERFGVAKRRVYDLATGD